MVFWILTVMLCFKREKFLCVWVSMLASTSLLYTHSYIN